jgi:hypothetical protein
LSIRFNLSPVCLTLHGFDNGLAFVKHASKPLITHSKTGLNTIAHGQGWVTGSPFTAVIRASFMPGSALFLLVGQAIRILLAPILLIEPLTMILT